MWNESGLSEARLLGLGRRSGVLLVRASILLFCVSTGDAEEVLYPLRDLAVGNLAVGGQRQARKGTFLRIRGSHDDCKLSN